jgi:hypothetical protein
MTQTLYAHMNNNNKKTDVERAWDEYSTLLHYKSPEETRNTRNVPL